MKRSTWLALICLAAPIATGAQGAPADPVSNNLRQLLARNARNLVAAAEVMPADKYSYHPTPELMTFGKTILHIAEVNNFACAKVADSPAPEGPKVSEADSKEKLIENLKASMDFCTQTFSKLNDAKLGEPVSWFGGRQSTRFGAAIEVTNDLIDHYASLAVYLRLNGQLPPTAKPK
jgi:hypothetical protein